MISGLLTDFYEITMMQGYWVTENNPDVIFDMFYRSQPFNNGYAIFAGLDDVLEGVSQLHFSREDLDFLRGTGRFRTDFLTFLESFAFTGSVYAMDEGSVIFPGEPIIRIEAPLIEAQLIESFILNTINFQSLIATKASRVYHASNQGKILEFGLRRAQGPDGARSASRAAYIGGAAATSNTLAGKQLGIPVSGTMAHSWVMAFENELEAFRAFAELYPDHCILLIDTYDTLGSGIEHAITVGKELQQQGKSIGVRIDSGDLSYLSREVRTRLDAAGLHEATIAASNDLNEDIIQLLVNDLAPIDSWGVGTHLVTGGRQSSMNGVYKLSAKKNADGTYQPSMKVSNNYEKTTNPGIKQVYRFFDNENGAKGDLIALHDEQISLGDTHVFYHPMIDRDFFVLPPSKYSSVVPLLSCKMEGGKRTGERPTLDTIRTNSLEQINAFHRTYKRLINPHIYKVSLSKKLKKCKLELINRYRVQQKHLPD
ncbi:MAG: nicotinate phosphoribosyltransferase [Spirochaetota bacterium]